MTSKVAGLPADWGGTAAQAKIMRHTHNVYKCNCHTRSGAGPWIYLYILTQSHPSLFNVTFLIRTTAQLCNYSGV